MSKKNICILYTGGTIGMVKKNGSYVPGPKGYLEKTLGNIQELQHKDMPTFNIHEYSPLMDSANMIPEDWVRVGAYITKNYHRYCGFIILHGTDTMAYTASALSFMLKNLCKPIILTGSQIPLSELRSDGKDNIIAAAIIAQTFDIPEVCVYFGDKLYRGCRTKKINASGFNAFASPNFEYLGTTGIKINIRKNLILTTPHKQSLLEFVPFSTDINIVSIRMFPGISINLIEKILQPPIHGAIIEAYGIGNIPENPKLIKVLEEAVKRGVVIAVCSQCLLGEISLEDYKGGSLLHKCGIINAKDMTIEATLTKMMYLFSTTEDIKKIKILMEESLRGELSNELYSTMR